MKRGTVLVVLMGLLLSQAGLAAEASFCKSSCEQEQRVCKAKGRELAEENGDGFFVMTEHNQLARTADKLQVPSEAERAGARANVQTRRMRYTAACNDSYLRCTRACASPAPASDSPVLTRRQKAG